MSCRYDREAGEYRRSDGEGCADDHCRVCNRRHVEGWTACAECLANTRSALRGIGILCGSLPEEVEHRGIEGEAMMLLGPSADPEARGHVEASVAVGRLPADYLEAADGEMHPLFVLGTWDMTVRDALEHDEPAGRLTVAEAIRYLDQQLTYLAGYEHLPFEEMSRDIRACEIRLQAVLHDQNQGDRANVGCFDCGGELERRITDHGMDDVWTCRRCHRRYTYAEYNFALRAKLEAELEKAG